MKLRIRKSVKIAPGVRLTVGEKSSSRKRRSSGRLKKDIVRMIANQDKVSEKQKASNRIFLKVCGIIMYIATALALIMSIAAFSFDTFMGIVLLIPTLICFAIARFFISASKS